MTPVEAIRREVERGLRAVRQAFRGVLRGQQLQTQVQRARVSGLAGEDVPDAEVMQHFGFSSAIPAGADVIVVPVGGKTAQSVVIASELGAVRIQLDAAGETVIYNQWGDRVHLKQDRTILVQAEVAVTIQAPTVTMSGDLVVDGDVTASGISLVHHVHAGVQTGGGSTGAPS